MTITEWCTYVNDIAVSKGWHNTLISKTTIGSWIALAHSELSEALEALRVAKVTATGWTYWASDESLDLEMTIGEDGKPEGFVVEMADVIIRVMDTCKALGLDLERAMKAKAYYNETRPIRHGGKLL